MNNLFLFHVDIEVPQHSRAITRNLLHPDLIKGLQDRACNTLGIIFSDGNYIYAKQVNGMYTRAGIAQ